MEAVAENRSTLDSVDKVDPGDTAWDEARVRVQAYLTGRRLGDGEWVRNCAGQILHSCRQSNISQGSELEAALREADRLLNHLGAHDAGGSLEFVRPLFFPRPPNGHFEQEQLEALLGQVKVPARPSETRPMRMQTSLSRLPSIRLIGGWIVLIALLFLVFLLTHR